MSIRWLIDNWWRRKKKPPHLYVWVPLDGKQRHLAQELLPFHLFLFHFPAEQNYMY
jgi:hypothetical protein